MASPEMNLLFILTGDIYQQPNVPVPRKINWDRFFRFARLNKVPHYVAVKVLEDKELDIKPDIRQQVTAIKKSEEAKLAKLRPALEVANSVFEQEPHLLQKTYLGYRFATHDVDFLVRDLGRARRLFESKGYQPELWWDNRSFEIVDDGFLEIEVYDKISPGPMSFIDEEIPWSGSREVVVEGVPMRLPSVEADLTTFLADMNFRTHEITLGDLLYLYRLAHEADWPLIAGQAEKYNWLVPFHKTIAILNTFHRRLYDEPSPVEKYFPGVAQVSLDLPFIMPLPHLIGALWEKGAKNLIKLPGYFSVRLKKSHPGLHRIYSRLVLGYLGQPLGKYIYRK
ncbi:MAG: hypothetical protein A2144_03810 [Chloroflexi bacterium RBG_16_50_9]|nr:MAG: hypothetical protein A2144_03810 [Chloroflexi bacterium RBG_16_50_9]